MIGALAEACLGLSGAIFQSPARNALGGPDLLGAGLAAVVVISLGLGGSLAVAGAALVGALAVYLLAYRRGLGGMRLILVGVGINALILSATTHVLTLTELHTAQQAHTWPLGSFNGCTWEQVTLLAAATVLLLPVVLTGVRRLGPPALGDDLSRALGLRVERARLALIVVAVAVSVAFVALVAPHRSSPGSCLPVNPAGIGWF
nr:iron chelate uptake ABC transporter family permease subunit [Rhizohabitans arisaemae]